MAFSKGSLFSLILFSCSCCFGQARDNKRWEFEGFGGLAHMQFKQYSTPHPLGAYIAYTADSIHIPMGYCIGFRAERKYSKHLSLTSSLSAEFYKGEFAYRYTSSYFSDWREDTGHANFSYVSLNLQGGGLVNFGPFEFGFALRICPEVWENSRIVYSSTFMKVDTSGKVTVVKKTHTDRALAMMPFDAGVLVSAGFHIPIKQQQISLRFEQPFITALFLENPTLYRRYWRVTIGYRW